MVIYADVLFLQNFIINYFLVGITEKILKEKSKLLNKVIAVVVTSIYSVIVIINNWKYANNVIVKFLLAIIIVLISYQPKEISLLIKYVITFYVVTYFLGGIMSSLINHVSNQNIMIFLVPVIALGFILIFSEILKNIMKKEKYTCNIKILLEDKIIMANALLDSGHDLQDIITCDTVVIINEEKIQEISEELFDVLKNHVLDVPLEYQTRIRMITYKSLGNENGILYGVRVDSVITYYEGKEYENKNVIVAISENKFTKFDAIIGLNLIEGGNVCGNSSIIKIKG